MKKLLDDSMHTVHSLLKMAVIGFVALTFTSCIMPPGNSAAWSDGSSTSRQAPSQCGSCRGSGRCNTCNGTGRFLGTGDTTCSTCSASGVCINCGGRGTW